MNQLTTRLSLSLFINWTSFFSPFGVGSARPGFLGALDCIVIPKGGRTKMVLGIYTKVNNNREKKIRKE
jgi:hypothetical protein